jgi:hypothetical protein
MMVKHDTCKTQRRKEINYEEKSGKQLYIKNQKRLGNWKAPSDPKNTHRECAPGKYVGV